MTEADRKGEADKREGGGREVLAGLCPALGWALTLTGRLPSQGRVVGVGAAAEEAAGVDLILGLGRTLVVPDRKGKTPNSGPEMTG